MHARPSPQNITPTRALALFALIPLLALGVAAVGWPETVGAPGLRSVLALAAAGTLALAAGLRIDQRRGPVNAALLVSQIAGLAMAMVAVQSQPALSSLGWAVVGYTTGLMHLSLGILVVLEALPASPRARRNY